MAPDIWSSQVVQLHITTKTLTHLAFIFIFCRVLHLALRRGAGVAAARKGCHFPLLISKKGLPNITQRVILTGSLDTQEFVARECTVNIC